MNTEMMNESNVAVIEAEKTVKAVKAEKTVKAVKAEKTVKAVKAEKTVKAVKTEKAEKTENAFLVEGSKMHAEPAQYEIFALHLYKQDAKKFVPIADIKKALNKEILENRMSVYMSELQRKSGCKLEKQREGKSVVAVKYANREPIKAYLKKRFPNEKF